MFLSVGYKGRLGWLAWVIGVMPLLDLVQKRHAIKLHMISVQGIQQSISVSVYMLVTALTLCVALVNFKCMRES